MRVAIISPFQFRLRRGIERFTYSLANQLAQDYDMEIILYAWASSKSVTWGEWHSNIRIRCVPERRFFQVWWARIYYWFWIRKDNPNWMLLNFIYHGEIVLPARKRYLYILHSPASQVPHRYQFIQQRIHDFPCMEFVAVSNMVKREAGPFLNDRKISVIHNGVDTVYFQPRKNRKDTSQKLRLVTLSALEARKGIQYVIQALALLRAEDIVYDIYGEGPYQIQLSELIKKLDLARAITLHNVTDKEHVVLNNAHVFCLMSKGEAFPIAPLEAMATGLPVIVSQYPPFDEFVSDEVGIQVKREDPEKVADAIRSLKDPTKRSEMGKRARRMINDRYDWQEIAAQYHKIMI